MEHICRDIAQYVAQGTCDYSIVPDRGEAIQPGRAVLRRAPRCMLHHRQGGGDPAEARHRVY